MLPQTDYEFPPTRPVLVFQLDTSRTSRHPLGHPDHSVIDEDPRKNRRFPQPGVTLGGMRVRPHVCCDNRAGFFRIAQPKLQGGISAHAQADQMGSLALEARHHSGDVVYREFPTICGDIFRDIAGRVASGIVGDATVATGEMASLGLPSADVRCEFMDEDDRISVATLLEMELGSCGFDIRHRFSPPSRICAVGCRDRKTDRVAIGPSMLSCHCVTWRSIAGVQTKRPRWARLLDDARGGLHMQPNTIDEAFTLNDDTGIVFGNGRFRAHAAACPSPPLSSQRVFTESSTGFARGSLSPMYLGRPEGLQLGRKDVAESGIRTEIQTGIHQPARSQNVPMITMQWFVVVCAPPAPDFPPSARRCEPAVVTFVTAAPTSLG
jgi:hypothetical protein